MSTKSVLHMKHSQITAIGTRKFAARQLKNREHICMELKNRMWDPAERTRLKECIGSRDEGMSRLPGKVQVR